MRHGGTEDKNVMYNSFMHKNKYKSTIFKNFVCEKSRKYFILLPAFYRIIWLMKSPQNFEKKMKK